MQSNKESNQKLIERFPFLMPRNRWTGEVPEDYDYSYTELDSMPDGWRKAFGEQMCEDIREELVRAEYLGQYRISQIKVKYGTLCWYDFGCTERMLRDIIPKYERLSARTCIRCGNPATKASTGWISPYCDTCAGKVSHAERFIPIEEWLSGSGDEVASERIAEYLNIKRGSAILRLRQITELGDGTPFEYVRTQYAGNKFEFYLEK